LSSIVAALTTTVNGIEGGISTSVDTALADGLADINAAIAELETQIGQVATG
jgi:hypothetical protein